MLFMDMYRYAAYAELSLCVHACMYVCCISPLQHWRYSAFSVGSIVISLSHSRGRGGKRMPVC